MALETHHGARGEGHRACTKLRLCPMDVRDADQELEQQASLGPLWSREVTTQQGS